jgi:hypothetical protein
MLRGVRGEARLPEGLSLREKHPESRWVRNTLDFKN